MDLVGPPGARSSCRSRLQGAAIVFVGAVPELWASLVGWAPCGVHTFSSGSYEAWITDEVGPEIIALRSSPEGSRSPMQLRSSVFRCRSAWRGDEPADERGGDRRRLPRRRPCLNPFHAGGGVPAGRARRGEPPPGSVCNRRARAASDPVSALLSCSLRQRSLPVRTPRRSTGLRRRTSFVTSACRRSPDFSDLWWFAVLGAAGMLLGLLGSTYLHRRMRSIFRRGMAGMLLVLAGVQLVADRLVRGSPACSRPRWWPGWPYASARSMSAPVYVTWLNQSIDDSSVAPR